MLLHGLTDANLTAVPTNGALTWALAGLVLAVHKKA